MHTGTINWADLYQRYDAGRQSHRQFERAGNQRGQDRPLSISKTIQAELVASYSLCNNRRFRGESGERRASLLRCRDTGNLEAGIFATQEIRAKARIRKITAPPKLDRRPKCKGVKGDGCLDCVNFDGHKCGASDQDRMGKGMVGKIAAIAASVILALYSCQGNSCNSHYFDYSLRELQRVEL